MSTSPLEHIVQHPIKTVEANAGILTPEGTITVFSDHISMILAAGLLLLLVVPVAIRRRGGINGLVPKGLGNGIEFVCNFIRENVARPYLGEYTDRFIPYIWSVFFFILTMNLLGLLPLGSIFPVFSLHLGGTATANIWVTATLALMTLAMMVVNGLRIGGKHFVAHLCPGPLWLAPLLVPLELVGFLAKTFALAVRLFANMVAGHTLLAVLIGFVLTAGTALGTGAGIALSIPIVLGAVAINMLELMVAGIQAFVFTYLTAAFIGSSIMFDHPEAEAH